jgi:hypothetical protein
MNILSSTPYRLICVAIVSISILFFVLFPKFVIAVAGSSPITIKYSLHADRSDTSIASEGMILGEGNYYFYADQQQLTTPVVLELKKNGITIRRQSEFEWPYDLGTGQVSFARPVYFSIGNYTLTVTSGNGAQGKVNFTVNQYDEDFDYCEHGQIDHAHDDECNDIPLGDDDDSDKFSLGLVTLSFDDGYKSIDDNIHLLGNYKSTQYLYSVGVVGATLGGGVYYTDFMTLDDARALYQNGHEIAAHTRSHGDLTSLATVADRQFEVDGSRLDLLEEVGVPVNNLAFPFGSQNPSVIHDVQKSGFVGSRTVDGSSLNNKTTDPYLLHGLQVLSTHSVAEVAGWIDQAITNKEWLILVFHRIEANCGGNIYCTTPATLSGIVNYLQSREGSLNVVTVKEGLQQMSNRPVSDGVAPNISQSNITISATSPTGASVSFSPTVTDYDSGLSATLRAICTIPNVVPDPSTGLTFATVVTSGYTFPIGTTQVTCTAADAGGNLGKMIFSVTVNDGTDPSCTPITQRYTPTLVRYWTDTPNVRDLHPEIERYKIKWFNGGWSGWYKPGVNDVDPKGRTNGKLVYFDDHYYEVEACPGTFIPVGNSHLIE